MPIELTAVRSLHPGQIDLRWRWSSRNAARPDFRVVRQSGGPAAAIADGRLILRLSDWYSAAGPAWGRVERLGFLIDRSAAEGGLEQASLELYFTAPGDAEPARVIVQFYDATTSAMQRVEILDVTSVNRTQVQVLPTDPVTHKWEIFHTSGGVPVSAGVVSWTISMPSVAPPTDKFTWTGAASTLVFERFASRVVRRENTNPVTFVSVVGTQTVPFLTILEATNLDTGEFSWDVQFTDDKLTAPAVRYYTLFVPDTSQPSGFLTATATALPGTDFDSPNRLYELLPPFHRYADEPDPAPAARGKGQLRSFLVPFGLAIDAARSGAERLRDTLDPVAARLDLLPHLARQIGWEPDVAVAPLTQRHDISDAPALFGTVGTRANLATLVNRVLGWPHRVKEFVNNIFLTNAPESASLWELWEARHNGVWSPAQPVTLTTAVDAHPAAVRDGAGTIWLFWQSDRNGRREIWRQRLGGVDPAPQLARLGAPDDTPDFAALEESPTAVSDGTKVWVFWSSDRSGGWEIWARTFAGGAVGSSAVQLTNHPAADRHPGAVFDPAGTGRIWLFWDSARRGPTDIWVRVYDLATQTWAPAERLTESPFRDENPSAVIDPSGRLWLFWTRDIAGRRELWCQTRVGAAWQTAVRLTSGEFRDESPAAVRWGAGILLLWHSNRSGPWQIWGQLHDGAVWHPATRLGPNVLGDKEPVAVIDSASNVRVYWRSQRRAIWYRSRTIDTDDTEMLNAMGTDTDHAHYTHVTGETAQDLYERRAVGVFLSPPTTVPATEVTAAVNRAAAFVEPFRSLQVRFVWITDEPAHTETLVPEPNLGEEWVDAVV